MGSRGRRHRMSRKRPLLVASTFMISLGVALVLGEGLVRLVAPQPLNGTWRIVSERGYYLNKPNGDAQHQFRDRFVRYRFNAFHLRGPSPHPQAYRLLVLGDSFAFGVLLEEDHTVVGQLQSFGNSRFGPGTVQFLNGGVGGWGTADYVAFLEDYGASISPQAVVVLLNTDDIGRSFIRSTYVLRAADRLALERRIIPRSVTDQLRNIMNEHPATQWFLEHSHLVQFVRSVAVKMSGGVRPDTRAQDQRTRLHVPHSLRLNRSPQDARTMGRALFRRMKQWCDEQGATLFVVTTGFQWLYPTVLDDPGGEPTFEFLRDAAPFFAQEKIPFHDMSPELAQIMGNHPQDFVIAGDFHPNEAGSLLIASIAWRWLEPQVANLLAFSPPSAQNVDRQHTTSGGSTR